jgi:hypothetical protein
VNKIISPDTPSNPHQDMRGKTWFFDTTLDQIGIKHGTDKATQFTRTYAKPHGYLPHLEKFFRPLRTEPIRLIEIGIGGGESARTWLEYFPNALIFGMDIVHDTNPFNTPDESPNEIGMQKKFHPRYTFFHGDATDATLALRLKFEVGGFDVIIDDGSHKSKDVIETFGLYWEQVKTGGLYVIEDLMCSYSSIFQTPGCPTAKEHIDRLLGEMHQGGSEIDSVYCARELAILRKK